MLCLIDFCKLAGISTQTSHGMLRSLRDRTLEDMAGSGKSRAHSYLHTSQGSRIQWLIIKSKIMKRFLTKSISNSHPFLWEKDHIPACLRACLASPSAFQRWLKRRHLNRNPGANVKSAGLQNIMHAGFNLAEEKTTQTAASPRVTAIFSNAK